jgi:hypothetical protein
MSLRFRHEFRHDVFIHHAIDCGPGGVAFTVGPVSEQSLISQKKGVLMFVMTDSQKVALSITVVDAKGNPANVDGAPTWTSSDASVVTVAAAEDGLSAVATAVGPLGTAQVNVQADADLGEGSEAIAGVLDVQIVGGKAVSLTIGAGVAEEQ